MWHTVPMSSVIFVKILRLVNRSVYVRTQITVNRYPRPFWFARLHHWSIWESTWKSVFSFCLQLRLLRFLPLAQRADALATGPRRWSLCEQQQREGSIGTWNSTRGSRICSGRFDVVFVPKDCNCILFHLLAPSPLSTPLLTVLFVVFPMQFFSLFASCSL